VALLQDGLGKFGQRGQEARAKDLGESGGNSGLETAIGAIGGAPDQSAAGARLGSFFHGRKTAKEPAGGIKLAAAIKEHRLKLHNAIEDDRLRSPFQFGKGGVETGGVNRILDENDFLFLKLSFSGRRNVHDF
jgi:hypothetical protein